MRRVGTIRDTGTNQAIMQAMTAAVDQHRLNRHQSFFSEFPSVDIFRLEVGMCTSFNRSTARDISLAS